MAATDAEEGSVNPRPAVPGVDPEPGPTRRVVGFSVPQLVSFLAPLIVLPLVAGVATDAEWAALGVGQALGAVVGIVVAYGWSMVGPVEVAAAGDQRVVGEVFFESLLSRGALWVATTPLVLLLSWPAAPGGELGLTATTALATATMGLSSGWMAVGLARPGPVTVTEHLPRLVVLVAAGLAIGSGSSLFLYPAAIAASSLVGVVLYAGVSVRPVRPAGPLAGILLRRLREQWSAGATTLAASAYSAGALFLVGLAASVAETAEMSSADRLYRVGLTVVIVLSSGFQAWVVHPDRLVRTSRRRKALGVHVAVGLVGGCVCAVAAPGVARLLFGPALAFDHRVSTAYGVAFLMVAAGTSLAQHYLVPDGQVRSALLATVAGVAVGVPLLLALSASHGAAGGAAALAVSELAVLGCLAWRVLTTRAIGEDGRR